MKKNNFVLWGAVVVIVLSVAWIAIQTYAQRSLQGRLRDASRFMSADNMGGQYQPYYLKSDYTSVAGKESPADTDASSLYRDFESAEVRKVIQMAEVSLKVKNVKDASQKIESLINSVKGIVINSQINSYSDDQISGRTEFKVMPAAFVPTLSKLRDLGKVETEQLTGEDITEQYVDLESRLANYQIVRNRLISVLEDRAKKVSEILEVERELARVTGEIEVMQGKKKFLDRQVSLATIVVNYHENRVAILRSLNVGEKFKDTIRTAAEMFINVFNGIIVLIAMIMPIVIWFSVLIVMGVGMKRIFRKKA